MANGIRLPGFKLKTKPDGTVSVERDVVAQEAKFDVSTRIARRKSRKVKVVRKGA